MNVLLEQKTCAEWNGETRLALASEPGPAKLVERVYTGLAFFSSVFGALSVPCQCSRGPTHNIESNQFGEVVRPVLSEWVLNSACSSSFVSVCPVVLSVSSRHSKTPWIVDNPSRIFKR